MVEKADRLLVRLLIITLVLGGLGTILVTFLADVVM